MTDNTKSLALLTNDLSPAEFKKQHATLAKFVKTQLRETKNIAGGESGDYGVIPYTKKVSLLKPGAEKLLKLFGFTAKMELVKEVENFDQKFVYYKYRCVITHAKSGTFIADAVRSCNNKEKKHASKDVFDVANTIEAVAQKRALVAATVQATMASEIFDAEVEDVDDEKVGSFKADENPERTALLRRLYGVAGERGFGEVALHTAAKRKYGIQESLSEMTNGQLKEYIEEIAITFQPVAKGEKPKKYEETQPSTTEPSIKEDKAESLGREEENVVEGEVIENKEPLPWEGKKQDSEEDTTVFHCYNEKKHGSKMEDRPLVRHEKEDPYQNPCFCNEECEVEWMGPKKNNGQARDWSTLGKASKTS